jgi:hypothetical protein
MTKKFLVAGLLVAAAAMAPTSHITLNAAMAAETPNDHLTFNKDVLPILQKNCQTCHRPGQVAPMSLLTYQDARPWAKSIMLKVTTRQMPPWNADPRYGQFSNDTSLKQSDIDAIAAWVEQGAPEGDPKDKPAPVDWPEGGWQIKPDLVVNGPATTVPARTINNVIEWTSYVMPSGITKDTWVTSMEIKPSEFAVTHHICVSFIPHRSDVVYGVPIWRDVQRDEKGVEIPQPKATAKKTSASASVPRGSDTEGECYLPGSQPIDYRPQYAGKLIRAGTDVVFSTHYTPNGKTEVVDRPQLGFTVAKQEPERKYVTFSTHGFQDREHFAITPNDPSWEAPTGVITFLQDAQIVWMSPHMHLRGKDMTYTLVYPDGRSEIILNVPHFDFNWQLGYTPAQPVRVPKGAKLVVTGHFDNSVYNKFNPDPGQTVYYGNMIWEEMFGGRTGIIVDRESDPKRIFKEETPQSSLSGNGG